MFENKSDEELLVESIDSLLDTIKRRQPELIEVIAEEAVLGEMLEESVKEKMRDTAIKTKEKTKLVSRTINHKIKKTGEHLDNLIALTKKQIMGESRDEIIANSTKVSTIIKRVITSGAIYLFSPTIALLHYFVSTSLRKKLKTREREKILADLKLELEICEEKINDATNANDAKKKYELMRLRNALKKNILRIQHAESGLRRNIG